MHTKSRHRLPDAGAPMFAEAIVRGVPETLDAGITSADLGKPEHAKAVAQHLRYIQALEECGLEVTALDADEKYPDSVFIEDTAVVTARCAILARPGADSRRREVHGVEEVLSGHYENIERIIDPGTLDGGDVLQVGDHFYIGLTSRTNLEGARQLSEILGGVWLRCLPHRVARVPAPQEWGVVPRGQRSGSGRGAGHERRVRGVRQDRCGFA